MKYSILVLATLLAAIGMPAGVAHCQVIPQVTSTSPDRNTIDVPVTTTVTATFNVDMNPATVDSTTFLVTTATDGFQGGTVEYDVPSKTATFTPASEFRAGDVVTAVVTTGVESDQGLSPIYGHVWSFTTAVNDQRAEFILHWKAPVGGGPLSIVAANVDADSDVDLATADWYWDDLAVVRNRGDASFEPGLLNPAGGSPFWVCGADLNGDGKMDLASANDNSNQISALLGNGDGTFQGYVNYQVAHESGSIIAADLDGDGDIDLAVTHELASLVSVLLNNGDASFAPYVTYAVDPKPYALFAADLNADDALDLVTANCQNDGVSVLNNNGDGTFGFYSYYGVGDYPTSVCAADLNDDGALELVTANGHSTNVSVLLNDGSGFFYGHVAYEVGDSPRSVVAGDFDGDGDLDLATANWGGLDDPDSTVSVLLNDGNASFGDYSTYWVGPWPSSVCAADLDEDGALDLAVANSGSREVTVLRNHARLVDEVNPHQNEVGASPDIMLDAVFHKGMDATSINDATFIVNGRSMGRCNGYVEYFEEYRTVFFHSHPTFVDGELVTAVLTNGLRYADGSSVDGGFVWSFTVMSDLGAGHFYHDADYDTGPGPHRLVAADLNWDGEIDLATADSDSNTVSVLMGIGEGQFQLDASYVVGDTPLGVVAADVDGDTDTDLVAVHSEQGLATVLKNTGAGDFSVDGAYAIGAGPIYVIAPDLDGDGDLDLATANYDGGSVSILLNDGDGVYAPDSPYLVSGNPVWVTSGDLDGDGDMDLATVDYDSATVTILANDGEGVFTTRYTYEFTGYLCAVIAGDFDGDFDLDLAFTDCENDSLMVMLNEGYEGFSLESTCPTGEYPQSLYTADLDGDNDLDLVTANSASNDVSVVHNAGDGTFSLVSDCPAGLGTSSVVACSLSGGEFPGLDIIAANMYGNNVSVLRQREASDVGETGAGLPIKFSLGQNWPNPFGSRTEIMYELPVDCHVRLEVYDVAGRKIVTLVDEDQEAGRKTGHWDTAGETGEQMSSGVYFYRLEAGGFHETRRLILLK
ncbi:T9SS type A sorting domain-containing protein [Candidatus Eisenbacteria bacterium]|uniref:T9SS type A sorting domain-containing protein n=1 Tax=Eiseniibacteriota bacterium TaxID=2212470 RepID=A0ABV6YKH4_UNCEI